MVWRIPYYTIPELFFRVCVMSKQQTSVTGITDLINLIRLREPEFNLSSFVRGALEIYLFGPEVPDTRRQIYEIAAREALEVKMLETKRQSTIINEINRQIEANRNIRNEAIEAEIEAESVKKSVSEQVEACMATILPAKTWAKRLPEYDLHGDYVQEWFTAAEKISEATGVTVLPSECYSYVKRHASCGMEEE